MFRKNHAILNYFKEIILGSIEFHPEFNNVKSMFDYLVVLIIQNHSLISKFFHFSLFIFIHSFIFCLFDISVVYLINSQSKFQNFMKLSLFDIPHPFVWIIKFHRFK